MKLPLIDYSNQPKPGKEKTAARAACKADGHTKELYCTNYGRLLLCGRCGEWLGHVYLCDTCGDHIVRLLGQIDVSTCDNCYQMKKKIDPKEAAIFDYIQQCIKHQVKKAIDEHEDSSYHDKSED